MDRLDHVRPRDHQIIVAAVERFAAEVDRAEVARLHAGAHRAVKDDDVIGQRIKIAAVGMRDNFQVSPCLKVMNYEQMKRYSLLGTGYETKRPFSKKRRQVKKIITV